MRDVVEVVYRNLANKLGTPKEFKSVTDLEKAAAAAESENQNEPSVQYKIPNTVIKGNLNL